MYIFNFAEHSQKLLLKIITKFLAPIFFYTSQGFFCAMFKKILICLDIGAPSLTLGNLMIRGWSEKFK